MPFAIHNLNTPAVEIDDAGTYTHNGHHRIAAGKPLHTAPTREDAEAWRRTTIASATGAGQ